ncbi:putative RING finger protein [Teratosphaeria destructans]|uniref:RING finger protein n=1 Tax=Teratosphaeria destructans TaxID=418781 RepID=A0A9W7VZA8_9PEZI|nr:putative RING finger protein [Teratosphaeria destructans]
MGQGQSQQQRQQQRAEPQADRRPSVLRRTPARRSEGDDGQDELFREAALERRPRSSPRSSSRRLSQLLHLDQSEAVSQPRLQPPLHRTASRLRNFGNIISRRDTRREATRPLNGILQHRTSYVRSGMNQDGADYYPPRLPSIDISSTFENDFEADAQDEPAPRSPTSTRLPRLHSLRPDRPFRHFTSSLRRRRSPTASSIRRGGGSEDQAAMLSRLLSVAAAATAATLMGNDHQALSEARSLTGTTELGSGGEDGSFDGFLRALQNGRIASALRQGTGSEEADGESDGDGASRDGALNFFRMFRFGASGESSPTPLSTGLGDPSEAGDSAAEGRMVPIIIVGIRSINPNSSSGSAADDLPPFLDALGNFPSPLPTAALGEHGHESIDSILRPPQNGTSFRHRRRASMGGFGMGRSRISDRLDNQRDHRSPDRARRERPWSVASSTGSNLDPRPPPASPASPSPEQLSRISSRNNTPGHSRPASFVANSMRDFGAESRRNSVLHRASTGSPLSSHTEETASLHSTHSATNLLSGDDAEPFRLQAHRRSDMAPNVHYPRFASGHPRRNGVVEPDHLPPLSRSSTSAATESSANGEGRSSTNNDSRSWIIYVLGGSYPENHPILTTPSLFTENPTYEDMMLLSALLGPAKAPVASDEDVQNAGGIYTIENVNADAEKTAELVAVATEEVQAEQDEPTDSDQKKVAETQPDRVMLETDQRCLVCLGDFEVKDVCRKLVKCGHLFHKECIDHWLTQGRNSCPLCRGQGVDEKQSQQAEGTPAAPAELDATAGA